MSSKKSSDEPTTSRGTENEKQSLEAENAKLKETIEKLKKKVKNSKKWPAAICATLIRKTIVVSHALTIIDSSTKYCRVFVIKNLIM